MIAPIHYHPNVRKQKCAICYSTYVRWTVDFLVSLMSYSILNTQYPFQMACYDHPMNFFPQWRELALQILINL